MPDAKVSASAAEKRNSPYHGTPVSRAQDLGIDAIIRIDATIEALYAQRSEIININRSVVSGARR